MRFNKSFDSALKIKPMHIFLYEFLQINRTSQIKWLLFNNHCIIYRHTPRNNYTIGVDRWFDNSNIFSRSLNQSQESHDSAVKMKQMEIKKE